MDLSTRCPHCGSIFSASLEQLQLRKGFVRCPDCAHIFDGYEAVVPSGAAAPAAQPSATPLTAPAVTAAPSVVLADSNDAGSTKTTDDVDAPSVVRQRGRVPTDGRLPQDRSSIGEPSVGGAAAAGTWTSAPSFTISSTQTARATGRAEPVVPSFSKGDTAIAAQAPGPRREPGIRSEPETAPRTGPKDAYVPIDARDNEHADDDDFYVKPPIAAPSPATPAPHRAAPIGLSAPLPDFLADRRTRHGRVIRGFWSVLILMGVAVLLAQLVYVYRAQIANQAPVLRPLLQRACASLDCQVPYARHIDMIAIMNSSLQIDPAQAGNPGKGATRMILQVTLRNNDTYAQEWPTLSLELVDFSGTVVVRKDLAAADYLSPKAASEPFAAKSEAVVSVPIKLDGIKINGYQLSKFFP